MVALPQLRLTAAQLGGRMVHGVRLREGLGRVVPQPLGPLAQVAEALGEQWPAGPVHADDDFAANPGHRSRAGTGTRLGRWVGTFGPDAKSQHSGVVLDTGAEPGQDGDDRGDGGISRGRSQFRSQGAQGVVAVAAGAVAVGEFGFWSGRR